MTPEQNCCYNWYTTNVTHIRKFTVAMTTREINYIWKTPSTFSGSYKNLKFQFIFFKLLLPSQLFLRYMPAVKMILEWDGGLYSITRDFPRCRFLSLWWLIVAVSCSGYLPYTLSLSLNITQFLKQRDYMRARAWRTLRSDYREARCNASVVASWPGNTSVRIYSENKIKKIYMLLCW